MQSYSEAEHQGAVQAVKQAREHIEADLHAEVRAMREEIQELKTLLLQQCMPAQITSTIAARQPE
jgi:voltage-gated sodium channel